ncbi:MAG: type II secretion system protein [Arcobacteraceae bacterium]
MQISSRNALNAFSLIEILFVITVCVISAIVLLKLSSYVANTKQSLQISQDKRDANNENFVLSLLNIDNINFFSQVLESPIGISTSYPACKTINNNFYVYHVDTITNLQFVYDSQNMTFWFDENLELYKKAS